MPSTWTWRPGARRRRRRKWRVSRPSWTGTPSPGATRCSATKATGSTSTSISAATSASTSTPRDVIPYWKTETVEAMDALRFQPGHEQGAGECVASPSMPPRSTSCAGFPDDLFRSPPPAFAELRGRPRGHPDQQPPAGHQGHVVQRHRTQRQGPARLEHEQITIVSHCTGWIHTAYPDAGIDLAAYERFRRALRGFADRGRVA